MKLSRRKIVTAESGHRGTSARMKLDMDTMMSESPTIFGQGWVNHRPQAQLRPPTIKLPSTNQRVNETRVICLNDGVGQ